MDFDRARLSEDIRNTSIEAILGHLRPLLATFAPDIPPAQSAGILAGVAVVVLMLYDRWPEVRAAMEGPGPAPG